MHFGPNRYSGEVAPNRYSGEVRCSTVSLSPSNLCSTLLPPSPKPYAKHLLLTITAHGHVLDNISNFEFIPPAIGQSTEDSTPETPCHQPASQAVPVRRICLPGSYQQPHLETSTAGVGHPTLVSWVLPCGTKFIPSRTRDSLSPDVPRAPCHRDELGTDPFGCRPISVPQFGICDPRNHLTSGKPSRTSP